jgi:hypothetical protein
MFAEYETGEQPALNPNWRREEAGLEIHMLGSPGISQERDFSKPHMLP